MSHSKVIDEIFDEIIDKIFPDTNPLYGKFLDKNAVYEFKNGSLIKTISDIEDSFKRYLCIAKIINYTE